MIKLTSDSCTQENVGIEKLTGVRSTYQLHTHDFYEFFLVTKGRAVHVVNGVSHIVERGTLVFIRPDDSHCYDYYRTDDFEFYNRGFSQREYETMRLLYSDGLNSLLDRPLPKHVKIDEDALRFFESSFRKYPQLETTEQRRNMIQMITGVVMYYMINLPEYDQAKLPPEWFTDLLEDINENRNYIEGLPHLLKVCNYSQEHINRAFKRYLNTTPTKYINELRLKYAADRIENSDESIITIAQESGFNNLSHFYSEFKRVYGITPKKIKKRM